MATEYFNLKTRISGDEFGAVHTGQLYSRSENRPMAIKHLYPESYQRGHKFYNELRIISSFHHQNISRFIGYCDEARERIIVHEYATNGSVADHLEDWNKTPHLTWAKRLKICIGAAKGLQYIHSALGEDNEATCGFINSRNILLDENMKAKIAFFGLSKQGPTDPKPGKHISKLQKSDMYSFGVIMFELLSGWRAHELSNIKYPEDQINLLQKYYHNNELDQFIDGYIRDQIDSRCLNIFKEVAYQCIMRDNQIKPSWMGPFDTRDPRAILSMDKVIEKLEDAADFQGMEV